MKEKNNKKKKVVILSAFLVLIAVVICLTYIPLFKNLNFGLDLQGGFEILYKVESIDGSKMNKDKMTATYKTLSKRIDSLGVSEPEIILEGDDKIRVKLAGVTDPEQARTQLSTVATLSFRDVDDNLLMTSDVLKAGKAKLSQNKAGEPAVLLNIKDKKKFYDVTNKVKDYPDGKNQIVIWLDYNGMTNNYEKDCNKEGTNCLSAAYVDQGFASDVIIEGKFTQEKAQNLVDLINSGSLPSKLTEISSKTVGASFGDDTLRKTLIAGIIGVILIGAVLVVIYHFAGFVATIAILLYTLLVFALFKLIGGVLTLPGIAALVLGIGMSVDSNVITFARIKEELYKGRSLPLAFKEGVKSSFSAILDSNLTTLIVAIIMFVFGESIIVTMFTMVYLTRILLGKFVKTGYFDEKTKAFINVKPEDIPNVAKNEAVKKKPFVNVNFLGHKKTCLLISIVIILIGAITIGFRGLNLGIDYKSGTDITIISEEKLTKKNLSKDLKELKLKSSEINIAEEETNIILDSALEGEKVKEVNRYFKDKYDAKVNIGVVSNIVQKELVENAILSILIALLGIIIYVSIRFKFSYAISGVIALVHDVLIIFAVFGIFHFEVSSMFIAAILAIIGYSINDTIVTFDRIRENVKNNKDKKLTKEGIDEVCNLSIQETFSRTIFTSITTIIPVVTLILLGSKEILTFNIAMLVGLIAGTYSSIFIATSLFSYIEKKDIDKPKKIKKIYTDEFDEKKIKGINC